MRGPTFSTPCGSTQTMDPPPAPIAETFTTGITSGKSPTVVRVVYSGSPERVSAMSLLVPPMSRVIRRWCGVPSAARAAATTPDAGPDSTVSIGRARAVRSATVPPLEVVMVIGARSPRATSLSSSCAK